MKTTAQAPTSSASSRWAEPSMTMATANVMAMGQKSKITLHSVCETPSEVSLIRCASAPAKSLREITMRVMLQIGIQRTGHGVTLQHADVDLTRAAGAAEDHLTDPKATNSHSGPDRLHRRPPGPARGACTWASVTALMILPVAYGMRMPQVELMPSSSTIDRYHQRYLPTNQAMKRNGVAGSGGASGAVGRRRSRYPMRLGLFVSGIRQCTSVNGNAAE